MLSYIVLDNEIKKRNSFELEVHNIAWCYFLTDVAFVI